MTVMIDNEDTVWHYFKKQLGRIPQDQTLKELGCGTGCGMDCCNIIDTAQGLIAICDPAAHAEILDGVETAVSVCWHG